MHVVGKQGSVLLVRSERVEILVCVFSVTNMTSALQYFHPSDDSIALVTPFTDLFGEGSSSFLRRGGHSVKFFMKLTFPGTTANVARHAELQHVFQHVQNKVKLDDVPPIPFGTLGRGFDFLKKELRIKLEKGNV
jgi:hypothetical protein